MLDGLYAIPWEKLTHAYGAATDVPVLLCALRTAEPGKHGEESPLWCLFGNIWHQGTVYEATAYAVPFLIELAAHQLTPDRVGILQLLAEIARGSSYRVVHGNLSQEPDFADKNERELVCVAEAHAAVANGFGTFVAMTHEKGEVALAAAHLLAQLPEVSAIVGHLLQEMLHGETDPLRRAGLLFLLGQAGDLSDPILSTLLKVAVTADETQRRAAVLSIARLQPQPLPAVAREAILDVVMVEDLEETFDGLPWDAAGEVRRNELMACLDAAGRAEATKRLIASIESGRTAHAIVAVLLDLLFPRAEQGMTAPLTARDLSPLQARAVRAMARAREGDRRFFVGHFPCWRLPDTRRGWRDLAAGREPTPEDMSLPLLADPTRPRRPVRPDKLKPGQRVVHRTFGLGSVQQTERAGSHTRLAVEFDDEGPITLLLASDGGV